MNLKIRFELKFFSQMFHPHVWYELKCLSDYIFEVNIPVPQFDHENEVDGLHFEIVTEIRPLWLRFTIRKLIFWDECQIWTNGYDRWKEVITILSFQLIKIFQYWILSNCTAKKLTWNILHRKYIENWLVFAIMDDESLGGMVAFATRVKFSTELNNF